jgi:hypothetical protein
VPGGQTRSAGVEKPGKEGQGVLVSATFLQAGLWDVAVVVADVPHGRDR